MTIVVAQDIIKVHTIIYSIYVAYYYIQLYTLTHVITPGHRDTTLEHDIYIFHILRLHKSFTSSPSSFYQFKIILHIAYTHTHSQGTLSTLLKIQIWYFFLPRLMLHIITH